jgi:hypothetical protein
MSIRRMIPLGTKVRYCSVCGAPQMPTDELRLTAHEEMCIEEMLKRLRENMIKRDH